MKKRIALLIALLVLTASVTWSKPPTPPYSLPSQTGNSGKVLTTDGTSESWGSLATMETDPVVKAISGIVKSNGSTIAAAVAGTDYSAGTAALATGILKSTTTTGTLSIASAGTDYQAPDAILTAIAALTTTEGSIVYFSGADTPVVLAKGVAYQRLRMNAAATAPEWEYAQDIITTKASGVTLTKAEFCGGYIRATATETLTYPSVTSDMVGCKTTFMVQGAYTLSVDVPVAVTPTLDGTALTAGNKASNSGFSGESLEAVIVSTTSIEFTRKSGLWVDGGA